MLKGLSSCKGIDRSGLLSFDVEFERSSVPVGVSKAPSEPTNVQPGISSVDEGLSEIELLVALSRSSVNMTRLYYLCHFSWC